MHVLKLIHVAVLMLGGSLGGGLRVPRLYSALPVAPVIDLGPLIIHGADDAAVVAEADRLGADGFVIEHDQFPAEYSSPSFRAREGVVFGLLTHAFPARLLENYPAFNHEAQGRARFLRAFRLDPRTTTAVGVAGLTDIDAKTRAALAAATTLAAQLLVLHRELARGALSLPDYERLRHALLAT